MHSHSADDSEQGTVFSKQDLTSCLVFDELTRGDTFVVDLIWSQLKRGFWKRGGLLQSLLRYSRSELSAQCCAPGSPWPLSSPQMCQLLPHAPTLCSFCLQHLSSSLAKPCSSFMGLNIAFLGVLCPVWVYSAQSGYVPFFFTLPVPCIFPSKCSCRRGKNFPWPP